MTMTAVLPNTHTLSHRSASTFVVYITSFITLCYPAYLSAFPDNLVQSEANTFSIKSI